MGFRYWVDVFCLKVEKALCNLADILPGQDRVWYEP